MPIRDSPPPSPHRTPCLTRGPMWRLRHGVGWGGVNPLWVYFHIGYRILDIYLYIYIYIYVFTIFNNINYLFFNHITIRCAEVLRPHSKTQFGGNFKKQLVAPKHCAGCAHGCAHRHFVCFHAMFMQSTSMHGCLFLCTTQTHRHIDTDPDTDAPEKIHTQRHRDTEIQRRTQTHR